MKYELNPKYTTVNDGGTRIYKVINEELTPISELYQDFRHHSDTYGMFFTAYPNSHNADVIPLEDIFDVEPVWFYVRSLQEKLKKLEIDARESNKKEVSSDTTCSVLLRLQGKAYPRTCAKCGIFGPCPHIATPGPRFPMNSSK